MFSAFKYRASLAPNQNYLLLLASSRIALNTGWDASVAFLAKGYSLGLFSRSINSERDVGTNIGSQITGPRQIGNKLFLNFFLKRQTFFVVYWKRPISSLRQIAGDIYLLFPFHTIQNER